MTGRNLVIADFCLLVSPEEVWVWGGGSGLEHLLPGGRGSCDFTDFIATD
jgi:hypothetical protein